MLLVKTLISALILWICVLAAYGIAWWGSPPEKLASYETGGKVILVVLIVGSLAGLVRLWRSGPTSVASR